MDRQHEIEPVPEESEYTDIYRMAATVQSKLRKEANEAEHDMRLLVGHANLLDVLMDRLYHWEEQIPIKNKWAESLDCLDEYSDSDSGSDSDDLRRDDDENEDDYEDEDKFGTDFLSPLVRCSASPSSIVLKESPRQWPYVKAPVQQARLVPALETIEENDSTEESDEELTTNLD